MTAPEALYVLGSICARGGSKGVPRKNLRPLLNRPLIVHTIECAKKCPHLNRVIISTDDEEIAAVSRSYGAEVPFMRPSELAQDNSSKWDVFRHLVETMEKKEGKRVDVLVDLDTGVPLRLPEDISRCIDLLAKGNADVVVTAYEAERNPYFNMVEIDIDGFAHVSKPTDPPFTCRQSAPKAFSLSPAVYAIRRDALWKYSHWAQSHMQIYVIPRERAVDIDSEVDFRFVEFLMQKKQDRE